jgi:hypothetical protein
MAAIGEDSYRAMYPKPDLTEEPSVSGTQQAGPPTSSPTRTPTNCEILEVSMDTDRYDAEISTLLEDGEVIRDFEGLAY